MFFKTQDDTFKFLLQKLDELEDANEEVFCDIATFGYYLNIGADGKDLNDQYPKLARDFIDRVKVHNFRMLVGLPDYNSYDTICQKCPQQKSIHNRKLIRFQQTANVLDLSPNIRFKNQFHAKHYRLNDIVLVGGMNLSGSNYTDYCYLHTDEEDVVKMKAEFNYHWHYNYLTGDQLQDLHVECDEDFEIIEPPTPKQLNYIKRLERETGLTFDGESKADASQFIEICKSQQAK
jgi:uncharacterized short protein YbdD (DUF466 family)